MPAPWTGAEDIDCALMIRALRAGADTAYKAVMKPKEGTILTVARVMAEDAERNCREMTDIVELFRAILKSGEAILKKTPGHAAPCSSRRAWSIPAAPA